MCNPDKRMTRNGLIKFYQDLISKGTLLVGSAGYRRMVELQERQASQIKYKRYYGTAKRLDVGTTKQRRV